VNKDNDIRVYNGKRGKRNPYYLPFVDFTLFTKMFQLLPHTQYQVSHRPSLIPAHNRRHGVVDGTAGKSAARAAGRIGRNKRRAFSRRPDWTADPTDTRQAGDSESWAEHVDAPASAAERPLLVRITAAKRRLIAIVRSAIKQELHAKLTEISAAQRHAERTEAAQTGCCCDGCCG